MCNKPKIKTTAPAPVAAAPVAAPETTTVADVDSAIESKKKKTGKQSLTIGISNTRGTGLNI
ncbi:hypothetical protein [Phascolarctobacterium faecium]|jgi:hypothetical protein|uniref:hypothetical protein n=1 Tax=Phascolarctobacterium faecium TaxID=33025 RepID=UPI0035201FA2